MKTLSKDTTVDDVIQKAAEGKENEVIFSLKTHISRCLEALKPTIKFVRKMPQFQHRETAEVGGELVCKISDYKKKLHEQVKQAAQIPDDLSPEGKMTKTLGTQAEIDAIARETKTMPNFKELNFETESNVVMEFCQVPEGSYKVVKDANQVLTEDARKFIIEDNNDFIIKYEEQNGEQREQNFGRLGDPDYIKRGITEIQDEEYGSQKEGAKKDRENCFYHAQERKIGFYEDLGEAIEKGDKEDIEYFKTKVIDSESHYLFGKNSIHEVGRSFARKLCFFTDPKFFELGGKYNPIRDIKGDKIDGGRIEIDLEERSPKRDKVKMTFSQNYKLKSGIQIESPYCEESYSVYHAVPETNIEREREGREGPFMDSIQMSEDETEFNLHIEHFRSDYKPYHPHIFYLGPSPRRNRFFMENKL